MSDIDLIAGAAEVALLALANATIKARPVARAIASAQADDLIADHSGESCVAHTAARSRTGAVPRAHARAIRLFTRGALPPRVANAKAATLTHAMAAAVVYFFTRCHLIALEPGEPEPAVGGIVSPPHLLQRIGVALELRLHHAHMRAQVQARCRDHDKPQDCSMSPQAT